MMEWLSIFLSLVMVLTFYYATFFAFDAGMKSQSTFNSATWALLTISLGALCVFFSFATIGMTVIKLGLLVPK